MRRFFLAGALCVLAAIVIRDKEAVAHNAFCSIDRLGAFTIAGNTLFIGTATGDSLASAQPRFRQTLRDSVSLPGPAFSQIVTIDRLSTSAPPEIRNGVNRSRGRVLLVPWVYGADCSPYTWRDNALWLQPGTRGLVSGRARPESEWIGGIPTFDVGSPGDTPYPSAPGFGVHMRGGTPLTADQLMTFYDSLPRIAYERVDRITQLERDHAHRQAILKRAEAHPEFASQPPTATIITIARREVALHAYHVRKSDLAGTWRFILTMPGHDSVVMYGRTQEYPASLIASPNGEIKRWELNDRAPFGYYLLMVMTKTLADLDIDRYPPTQRQGYLSVSFEPELVTTDSSAWFAGADIYGAVGAISDTASLRSIVTSLRRAGTIGMRPDRPRYAPGRIMTKRDGSARLGFDYTHNDDSVFPRLRAERISKVVWTPK